MYFKAITFQDSAFKEVGGCLEVTSCEGETLNHIRCFIEKVQSSNGQIVFHCNKLEVFLHTSGRWYDLGFAGNIAVFKHNLAEFYTGPFVIDAGIVVWTERKKEQLIFYKLFFYYSIPLPNEPAIIEEVLAVERVYSVS